MVKPTVLLVEDNEDDAELVMRAFRRAGVANPIQHVVDGDQAVAYLGGSGPFADRVLHPRPGLVLLDLKLPRRSGFEVLQWLRGRPETRRLPVVVLTSSDDNSDIGRAYDLGANSYLVKPVATDALSDMAHTLGLYWLRLNHAAE